MRQALYRHWWAGDIFCLFSSSGLHYCLGLASREARCIVETARLARGALWPRKPGRSILRHFLFSNFQVCTVIYHICSTRCFFFLWYFVTFFLMVFVLLRTGEALPQSSSRQLEQIQGYNHEKPLLFFCPRWQNPKHLQIWVSSLCAELPRGR